MPSLRACVATGLVAVVAVVATTGCGASSSTPRSRVAADLGCTARKTSVHKLDGGRWLVEGCGRSAVYLCTTPVRDCWREVDGPAGAATASAPGVAASPDVPVGPEEGQPVVP